MRELALFPTPGEVVNAINALAHGRGNASGTVTLTTSATSTTVSRVTISGNATVVLTPMTANAAGEIAAGTLYVSAVANGSFTIAHASNAQADRTYRYLAMGG